LVLIVGFVIGALIYTYHQGVRHRNVQVKLGSDRAAARFLARAGIDALKHAFREAPDPGRIDPEQADTRSASLLPFMLGSPETLARTIEARTRGTDDHRELLDQLLGAAALAPLDDLARRFPSARVRLELAMSAAPLVSGSVLKDFALKSVTLRYRSTATVRRAQEAFEAPDSLTVYSRLPAVVSRMTLAATGLPGGANTHRVTASGADAGGMAPLVLFHAPADLDPLTQDPFRSGSAAAPRRMETEPRVAAAADLVGASKGRGLVLLSGGGVDRRVDLQVASGAGPFGEYHSIYPPAGGRTSYPAAQRLADQPPKMRAFAPPDPRDPRIRQAAFVQGAVFGFFDGIDAQALLGDPPAPAIVPSGTSQIKLYGTATHPSAAAVLGNVHRVMAGLSGVATDRDATSRDEGEQRSAVGRDLPVREGIDPFLRDCDASTFAAELARERAIDPPYARLLPFGEHGRIANENATADLDGDGTRETRVASEAPHDPLPLDLASWKYSNLFETHDEYRTVMSKYVSFPANLSLALAAGSADRSAEVLRGIAFGKDRPPGAHDDWLLTGVMVPHRDGLHAGAAYLDTRGAPPEQLDAALAMGSSSLYPGQPTYVIRGQRMFERYFMPGGVIDLLGLRVQVLPERPEDPPVLSFDREVQVAPGSGGVLDVPIFRAKGLSNAGEPGRAGPLLVRCDELVLAGRGPFEAVFVPGTIVMEGVTDYAVIRGSLALSGAPTSLSHPLVVCWDPRTDPTSPVAPLEYRIAFAERAARIYDLLDRP
jgi:hypothetical protein